MKQFERKKKCLTCSFFIAKHITLQMKKIFSQLYEINDIQRDKENFVLFSAHHFKKLRNVLDF